MGVLGTCDTGGLSHDATLEAWQAVVKHEVRGSNRKKKHAKNRAGGCMVGSDVAAEISPG